MLELVLWGGFGLAALAALGSAGHALLNKRDPRAALGWIVLCLAVPLAGVCLYWLLGVNRIRTRARGWQEQGRGLYWREPRTCPWSVEATRELPFRRENYSALLNLSDAVTRRPLLQGNRVAPLHNGEEAFPAMLEAIEQARSAVCLSTYIFESNDSGRRFAHALTAAAERGVAVRVLVDALGECYSWPRVRRLFRASGVKVARFLPLGPSWENLHFNLRNHRKLLVVDGTVGFTGGMNLGDRHLADTPNPRRVADIHFRVVGPVVGQMREAFAEDWYFSTREQLEEAEFPPPVEGADGFCRGISAGPNEDFEKLHWLIVGALGCARRRVRIMTPYFIPDRPLVSAINAAVLRGVAVDIILPQKNNLPFVAWASQAYLWEMLQYGVEIRYQPPPFVHSKLLLVDDHYALLGSANLDPRSLRLNFEFNLEVYDRDLLAQLAGHFDAVREVSRPTSLHEVDSRPLPVRLRDAGAKLLSPYL